MIHPKAIIEKGVILGEDVSIGPYAYLESGVHLGKGVKVSAFAHLRANTYIGDNTFIGSGSVIGEVPQMIDAGAEKGKVYIGKDNIIREYVTINCSSFSDKATSLGDGNFLMACSHVAHDCKIANNVVICNGTLIAGHIEIGDKAFISGNVTVHQFVKIGRLAMIGGLSRINQDVPPFMMVVGDSKVWGLNLIGLKRADFSKGEISQIRKAYKILYRKELLLKSALDELGKLDSLVVKEIIVFILSSKRGICGPKRSSLWEKLFLDYPYFIRRKIPTYESIMKFDPSKFDKG
ncbi:MAG: acyl-ACP--UDP-N-acetylglucosamine O-acyltransferase [Candidatus Omnitrophica bacterium]|nr:acyl-ACP--UDP-N-acetylglucosamine O-acyltransferase [Candidatus Omnitrophota bacterium]